MTTTKLPCSTCGMIANLDPWLHAERYGHEPSVIVARATFVHRGDGSFTDGAGRHLSDFVS